MRTVVDSVALLSVARENGAYALQNGGMFQSASSGPHQGLEQYWLKKCRARDVDELRAFPSRPGNVCVQERQRGRM